MSRFWWGQKRDERKLRWISWDKMRLPKYKGGLDFRDFEAFNMSSLAEQDWGF